MAEVKVTLLGGFGAAVGSAPVPAEAWRLRKARELVKLLALAPGRRLHRDQLMDVLWRDRPPRSAANNLHQAVHVARRALGSGAIEVRDELVRLVADVDVDVFEAAAAQARSIRSAAAYRSALRLYTGELLPENRYDDWASERRDALAALAEDLAEELTLLGPEATATPSLPADASSFVGRERELGQLTGLVARTRLLTLAGAGGVGKTRLALALARGVASSLAGGAAFVELADVTSPSAVADAVASALDVRALPGQDVADAVAAHLAPRALLLVLDNCEHVLAASSALAEGLLRQAPGLRIVATSREPLRRAGEVVFRVPSLDIPDPDRDLDAGALLEFEAVRLFVERAGAASPGFAIEESNAQDVARICFRLDGLPLALELAAARVGALAPAAIVQRLDDRFRILRTDIGTEPTRQQTLLATLQWSHDLLDPDERTLFRRLSVFAGGFDLDAVEAVCGADGLEAGDVAHVLARLVEKSLVSVEETSGRRRYRLLETVLLYARERLAEAGEHAAFAERQAMWALDLATRERGSVLLGPEAANLRAALDTLLDRRLDDALRLCVALRPFWLRRIELAEAERRFDQALAGTLDGTPLRAEGLLAAAAIVFRSGDLAKGARLAEESHAIAVDLGDPRAQWRALQFLGEGGVAADATDSAHAWFEQALALARAQGLVPAEAIGVYSLGVVRWMRGELAEAEDAIEESIALLAGHAVPGELMTSPLNIAEVVAPGLAAGRLPLVFEDTLQPFSEITCEAAVSYMLANQAAIARARGDLARARTLLDRSGARFGGAGDDVGAAVVLVRRAYLALAEHALEEARSHLERALALRRAQGDRRAVGLALCALALVEMAADDRSSAETWLVEARALFRRAGDRWGLASALWRSADLALARGRDGEAEAGLEEALAVLSVTNRRRWIANTMIGLAEIAHRRGDDARAEALFLDARDHYQRGRDSLAITEIERRLRLLRSR